MISVEIGYCIWVGANAVAWSTSTEVRNMFQTSLGTAQAMQAEAIDVG